jgi:repressor LexA
VHLSNIISISTKSVTTDIRNEDLMAGAPKPKRSAGLSATQESIMRAIAQFQGENGFMPTMREIAELVGMSSVSGVSYQLQQLQASGYLEVNPNLARAIEILIPVDGSDSGLKLVSDNPSPKLEATLVPLVGQIAAGGPLLADQNTVAEYPLPRELTGAGELFMLEVKGDSMIDAAICPGDLVVVRRQNTADNGDIVAALLGEEATVKTYKKQDGQIWLLPRNSNYAPIDGNEASIMGKVVTVLRRV